MAAGQLTAAHDDGYVFVIVSLCDSRAGAPAGTPGRFAFLEAFPVMGCRCNERADALRRVVYEAARGDIGLAMRDVVFIGRTLREDARSGELKRAAAARLQTLRAGMRRR